jgi:tetratricopeptide (TPR) repeat protein
MYIKRNPLGQGNLSFRKRRAPYPVIVVILYLGIFGAAIFAMFNVQTLQPTVSAWIGPPPTATPQPELVVQAAEAAYHSGDLGVASELYGQAAQIQPDNLDILAPYGRILVLNGQLDEAHVVADQMIAINPEDARGWAIKSRAYDWQGKYQDAVVAGLKAIELDNNYAPAHAYLAEAYADLGRLRQAREQAELAIQLDPYDVDARRDYGYVLEFYGDYAGAIQQYQQAQTIEPNLLELWYGLARNYRGAKQMEEAIATFNQIAARVPNDPSIYVELGKTYFEMREDDAAQENLEQAVALVCEDCPLYDSLQILEDPTFTVKSGDLEFFTQSRPLPDKVMMSAWNRLGQVYYTRRNYESAIAVLEEAIACGTRSRCEVKPKDIPIESYYVTASAYFYLDKCNLAEDRAKTALDIYVATDQDAPNTLSTILCVFKLCRDDADTPVAYSAPGFTNGFPDGYEEPDCRITRGTAGGEESESTDESTPTAP